MSDKHARPQLEFVEGTAKGKVFSLDREQMSIGRSPENDISIPSESISRRHAILTDRGNGSYSIRDNDSKNGVVVNGQKVEAAVLETGDVVQLGTHVVRFSGPPKAPVVESLAAQPYRDGGSALAPAVVAKEKVKRRRIVIYGAALIVVLFGAWQYQQENGGLEEETTTEAEGKETESRPQLVKGQGSKTKTLAAIEDPTLTKAEHKLEKLNWGDPGIREAEQYFRRGQREYLTKNYQRSIRAFETALSFNRKHPLARSYLQLALFDAKKEAQEHMDRGVKYFQSLQYLRAIYHFRQVVSLTHYLKNQKMRKEAGNYITLSERSLRAAELFP